jgi:hypothetical protein
VDKTNFLLLPGAVGRRTIKVNHPPKAEKLPEARRTKFEGV